MATTPTSSSPFSPIAIRLRLMHRDNIAFGPGKADLLEAIAQSGSITQAAKHVGMSYRRAWQLVDTMNHCFTAPLVETQTGGSQGGGTALTQTGINVLNLFRAMEKELLQQSMAYQQQWDDLLKP